MANRMISFGYVFAYILTVLNDTNNVVLIPYALIFKKDNTAFG